VAKNGQKISQKGRFSLFSKNIKKKTRKNISSRVSEKKGRNGPFDHFFDHFWPLFWSKINKIIDLKLANARPYCTRKKIENLKGKTQGCSKINDL
jgi:hypothetical protein